MTPYATIPQFGTYRVGTDGSVWKKSFFRKRAGRKTKFEWKRCVEHVRNGVPHVWLDQKQKWHLRPLPYIVLRRFTPFPQIFGGRPKDVRHWDGNLLNNSLDNLCWAWQTPSLV